MLLGCAIDRGITSSTCDANGNTFSFEERLGNLTTNTWNGENRLVQVEHPGGDITTYTYNADGLRVREEHDGVETRFVYDGNNLLRETDDTNLPEADYTYIPQAYAAGWRLVVLSGGWDQERPQIDGRRRAGDG